MWRRHQLAEIPYPCLAPSPICLPPRGPSQSCSAATPGGSRRTEGRRGCCSSCHPALSPRTQSPPLCLGPEARSGFPPLWVVSAAPCSFPRQEVLYIPGAWIIFKRYPSRFVSSETCIFLKTPVSSLKLLVLQDKSFVNHIKTEQQPWKSFKQNRLLLRADSRNLMGLAGSNSNVYLVLKLFLPYGANSMASCELLS